MEGFLGFFKSHSARNQTEVFKQPHAMGVYRKDIAIERIQHHAARGLHADTWEAREVALQIGIGKPTELTSRKPAEVFGETAKQLLYLTGLDSAQSSVMDHAGD